MLARWQAVNMPATPALIAAEISRMPRIASCIARIGSSCISFCDAYIVPQDSPLATSSYLRVS